MKARDGTWETQDTGLDTQILILNIESLVHFSDIIRISGLENECMDNYLFFFCYYYQNRVYLSQKLWILLLCIYRGVGCTVYLSFSGDSSKDSGRIWSPGHICHCSTNFQFKGEHGRPVRDMYCYFYKLLFSPNEALTETTVLPFWIHLMWACRERERDPEPLFTCRLSV